MQISVVADIQQRQGQIKNRVFFVFENELEKFSLPEVPALQQLFKTCKFTAKCDELMALPHVTADGQVYSHIFLGLGSADKSGTAQAMENIRRALCWLIARARKMELKIFDVHLSATLLPEGFSWQEFCSQVVTMLLLASYKFKLGKASDAAELDGKCQVNLLVPADVVADAEQGKMLGLIVGQATNWYRNLVDLPPNIATPPFIAEQAQETAKQHNLEINVFGPERAKELSMGGFLAVQAGSKHDGQFVEMKYHCGKPDAKTVVLVGKGVTFDTGGVSLKPASAMKGMKYDMSGAAAVLATIQAISQIKPSINVIAIAPLVENMPGGGSYRQDDIVMHYNGLTTEIDNTDAEGRLILADALAYAVDRYKPDYLIDVATLTGACVVALGHFYSGLMTNNQQLADKLMVCGEKTGDWLWQLPMHRYYKQAIKSAVADLSNCGASGYGAGTITAAKFLEHFVGDVPWAHIDIAGTEWDIPDSAYAKKISSGVGVRLLVEFILNEQ